MARPRIASALTSSQTPPIDGENGPPLGPQPVEIRSVGRRLHEIRAARELSLRALAELSGLNVNTLSLIENDRTSPSVSTLQRLSQCLRVPLTDFFRAENAIQEVVHQKVGLRLSAPLEAGAMEDLAAGMQHPGAEPLLLALRPSAQSGPAPIVHTGREFIYCLEGCITYVVQNAEYVLEAGDSLCFEAYLPHRWKNTGVGLARMILVLCPMDARDDPKGRHFSK
jgi:transcriptional regulator with XRE-family HTH domain